MIKILNERKLQQILESRKIDEVEFSDKLLKISKTMRDKVHGKNYDPIEIMQLLYIAIVLKIDINEIL